MLSREAMSALALAILWVNALLIAAAAATAASRLARTGRGFGPARRGTIARGDGPSGAIATVEVSQVGRLTSGASPRILFHERSRTARVDGGVVTLEGGQALRVTASSDAAVWVDDATMARTFTCPDEAAFDLAAADARKARGFARDVVVPVATGEVFVAKDLVSTFDPAPWIARRVVLGYAFALGELAIAGACTALALHPPAFGAVSTAGGALAFVFFLLVQPAGTLVRDALRPPSRAPRRETWRRGAARPAEPARTPSRS